jgi:hypothetical protein
MTTDMREKESLGKFYELDDYTIGNIIEFLNSSEVKDLRFVSRALKNLADNEDEYIKMYKRPRHANLAMLKYKMLDEERIEKIINNLPFPFPPNCYYLETVTSQNDKIFSYTQYIVQGESVKIEEIKKNQGGEKAIFFTYYYRNNIRGNVAYTKEGKYGVVVIKAPHLRIDYYEIDKAANHFKHMDEIIKKSSIEPYEFEIPYLVGESLRYIKFGIKKIS